MDDGIASEIGNPDRKTNLSLTLRRRILTMELPPGAVLDEVALSEEFGLSRPPVRELMRQMAGEGYIELEANRAARVSSMSYQSLRDFFLLAPMIYITANKLAAENGTRGQLDVLKRMQQSFRKAVDNCDVEGRVFYNDQFHRQIGEMAHNVYLVPSLRRLQIDHARIGKVFYKHPNTPRMQEELELATQQHDEMIDAIGKRDPDAAGELARLHLELSRRNMAMYAAPEGLETPTL
ncbi:GntR family transcriptional regulator (plasmid) [Rhizobium beringeri]|jgi:DNA-binding GntR family transcriptional regulator|uniref:GntR family transcriptional regulator n=1 Tax=Rhizobium beringeri TaxID=3019934 RepID=A0ABY1XLZ8_9HYPH|nr:MULTISPECIES: GntR family transcriptional regulator [Rhizobium]MBY5456940.1 GntR family transcriptional regulator [Rhizobium leguminosarum]NKL66549.1 FCD domain-containing protein [Rhizobium leguminosarum bv. viciae]TAU38110.1 GntR family transcriptional regulator [Rhizobium leguminosarum]TBC67059.1 GntR family transcriptional regulator [Rhizobium leguminosarum]TBC89259.1 GntR family transcriptional regulator [Rhizobium leguminosarum]